MYLKRFAMNIIKLDGFNVIGITVRTSNSDGHANIDIPLLWNKFMSENIVEQIPNKIDNTIYSIYTTYDGDYTKPYTTLLGCRVTSLDNIPSGLVGQTFNAGIYNKYVAKGNILAGIVIDKWKHIWSLDINRAYTQDFEVYGVKSQNLEDAEVDIFIAVK